MSLLQAFQECGWPAYVAAFFSAAGLMVGAVALALAVARARFAAAAAAFACAVAFVAASVGPVGTLLQRRAVEQAVGGGAIEPSQRLRILEAGYAEAAQCTTVGLGAAGLPLLLAAASLAIVLAGRGPAAAGGGEGRP